MAVLPAMCNEVTIPRRIRSMIVGPQPVLTTWPPIATATPRPSR